MVDRVGVCGGHGGTGCEVVSVDLLHQTGMVDHHLGGPQVRRRIARAADKFLPHAAVKKSDIGHMRVCLFMRRLIG